MRITQLTAKPSSAMADALARFEKRFSYPLGPDKSFSISHGPDYSLFFRSMGEARIYLAEGDEEILGALATVRRRVLFADGTSINSVYLCDTKVLPERQRGVVLGRLAIAAYKDTVNDGFDSAFSVVMEGSLPTPHLTGRLGVPPFREIDQLAILRIETSTDFPALSGTSVSLPEEWNRPVGGVEGFSSKMGTRALTYGESTATLTDTLLGKRLWQSDGVEMISAHLGDIRFSSLEELSGLIRTGLEEARALAFPAIFVALPRRLVTSQIEKCEGITVANASVFGTPFPSGGWMVNTSEI